MWDSDNFIDFYWRVPSKVAGLTGMHVDIVGNKGYILVKGLGLRFLRGFMGQQSFFIQVIDYLLYPVP